MLGPLLPALGVEPPAPIPPGALALGALLLKVGLGEWCRLNQPASAARPHSRPHPDASQSPSV